MNRKRRKMCDVSEKKKRREKKKKCLIESLLIFAFFRTLTNSIDYHEEERVFGRLENGKFCPIYIKLKKCSMIFSIGS